MQNKNIVGWRMNMEFKYDKNKLNLCISQKYQHSNDTINVIRLFAHGQRKIRIRNFFKVESLQFVFLYSEMFTRRMSMN